jgi:hypothetical protein
VQSSVLYETFCAWAKAAGEYEWKQKGFSQALKAKGLASKASNGMHWLGIRLVKTARLRRRTRQRDWPNADALATALPGSHATPAPPLMTRMMTRSVLILPLEGSWKGLRKGETAEICGIGRVGRVAVTKRMRRRGAQVRMRMVQITLPILPILPMNKEKGTDQ